MEKKTEKAIVTGAGTSSAVEKLKALYATKNVETKDFSLKEAFEIGCKKAAPYVQDDGTLLLPIIGITSRWVRNIRRTGKDAFHTMITLEGGVKTGGFSSALYKFAEEIYLAAKLPFTDYASMSWNKPINVKVGIEKFDGFNPDKGENEPRMTYTFTVIDGAATEFKWMTSAENYGNLINASSALALPAIPTEIADAPDDLD